MIHIRDHLMMRGEYSLTLTGEYSLTFSVSLFYHKTFIKTYRLKDFVELLGPCETFDSRVL